MSKPFLKAQTHIRRTIEININTRNLLALLGLAPSGKARSLRACRCFEALAVVVRLINNVKEVEVYV